MSDERKSIPLGQAPRANPKVEELRTASVLQHSGDPTAVTITGDPAITAAIVESLQDVYDPEIPVNVFDLGLIYAIAVDAAGRASVRMTLTAPACPVADSIVREVEAKVRGVPGVTSAKVELVWSPPWDKSRMSEAALLELGL